MGIAGSISDTRVSAFEVIVKNTTGERDMLKSTRILKARSLSRVFSFIFTLSLLQIGIASGTSWAYSDLYVFGDSLSDQGNFYALTQNNGPLLIPPAEYSDGTTHGRFTNGKNYIDYLSGMLGLASEPSLLGGNNYAYGGSRTDSNPYLDTYGHFSSLLDQYTTFAAAHPSAADPNALYIVWAGANDLQDIIQSSPSLTSAQITADLMNTANNVTSVVSDLALKGAHDILVPNLPDLGVVPLMMAGAGPNRAVSQLTQYYNSILSADLGTVSGINLIRFDTFGFLDNLYYNGPFANVDDPAYDLFVLPGGQTVPDPQDYLSWDGLHPTTGAHELLAEQVYSAIVPEPSSILLYGPGLIALFLWMGGARRRAKTGALKYEY
jgi:phospholipase/lecithinase/hemolysin